MNTQMFSQIVITLALIKITLTAPIIPTALTTEDTITTTKQTPNTLSTIDRLEQNFRAVEANDVPLNSIQDNFVTPEQFKNVPNEPAKIKGGNRQDKMLGYFGYFPQPMAPVPTPFYPPPNYYNDYGQMDEDEDIMSRANRRRPQSGGQTENSPIYYIRLPPTPYMFVPGYGYISQPPTITPMNAFSPMNQMAPMQSVPSASPLGINPFINLPLNFLSNGKPTSIYQWGGNPMYQPNPYSQFGYPQRPTRPSYKPKTSYLPQDSKIHHLKGQYLFNGRPEDIYVLGNSYNSIYQEPIQNYY